MAARTRKKKKPSLSPAEFFGQAVPLLLSRVRALCADRGGRFCVIVEGEGEWLLDFNDASVTPGRGEADLVLTLDADRFATLSGAKVELRKLVVDGDVQVEGDRDRIEDLSFILAFLQS